MHATLTAAVRLQSVLDTVIAKEYRAHVAVFFCFLYVVKVRGKQQGYEHERKSHHSVICLSSRPPGGRRHNSEEAGGKRRTCVNIGLCLPAHISAIN